MCSCGGVGAATLHHQQESNLLSAGFAHPTPANSDLGQGRHRPVGSMGAHGHAPNTDPDQATSLMSAWPRSNRGCGHAGAQVHPLKIQPVDLGSGALELYYRSTGYTFSG